MTMANEVTTQTMIHDVLTRLAKLHDQYFGADRFALRSLAPRQQTHLQATLGSSLPQSLLTTWGDPVVMGALGTVGALPGMNEFFDPVKTLIQWQLHTAVVYELRQGQGLQDEASVAGDQAIPHDVFNKGWFPLGVASGSYRWLCIDLAPGPAGKWGQLIEVPRFDTKSTEPIDPSQLRVVAPSWLAFLASVVQVWESAGISRSESVREWRAPNSEREVSPQGLIDLATASSDTPPPWWRTESAVKINVEPVVNNLPPVAAMTDEALLGLASSSIGSAGTVPKLLAREADILSRIPVREHSYKDTDVSNVLSALLRWASSPASVSTGLLVGVLGSGRTSILRALAERLLSKGASTNSVPIPILVDLWSCAHFATLEEAMDDWVYRQSGQPKQGAAVLLAVEQGRCLLLLDNVEALMTHGRDAWTWCCAAVPVQTPVDVTLRTGARLLVSCASDAVPAPEDVAHALGALTPGWSDVDAIGFALKDMDIAWDSDRVGAVIKARWGQKKRMEYADGFLEELTAAAWPPAGHDTRSWTWRPAWLDCVFNPGLARELETVGARKAGIRGLMHAWPNWFERRRVILEGGLSAQQLQTLALDIALQLWDAVKSTAAKGERRHVAVPVQQVADSLVALKPNDAAIQERIWWQVRLSLGLTQMGVDRLSFSTYSMHLSVIFNALTQAVRQGDLQLVGQLLSRHPLTENERDAVICAWGVDVTTPWSDAMDRLLAEKPCDLLRLNLRLIADHWYGNVRQQEAYPENGMIPVLSQIQALLSPFQGAGMDFSGQDFSNRNLQGANFEGACLNGCRFDGASLEGANLRNAQAADTSFRYAKANGMQAQGLQACGSQWYFAALDNADFSHATLCNSRFTDITGSDCCIEGADLSLAVLDASAAQVMQPPPHPSLLAPLGELTPQWRRPLPSEYADLVFSPSGQAMAATDMSGGVNIWHSQSGIRARVWVDSEVSLHVVFLPCERRLLTANMAGEVKIWDVLSGKCLQQWQAHDHPVHALALSLCGQWLATADLAGNLKCWSVSDAALMAQMHLVDRQISRLICGSEEAVVWVSFAEGGAALCDCRNQVEKTIPELAQKGVLALAGESGSAVALVPGVSGVDVIGLSSEGVRVLRSNIAARAVILSPNGQCLLAAHNDRPPQLMHTSDGRMQTLSHAPVDARAAAFSPDGRQLVLVSARQMQWLDTTTGRALITHELPDPRATNRGWHWLPDGKRIATHQHATVLDAMLGLSQKTPASGRSVAEETRSHCFGVHPNGQAVFSLTMSRAETSNAICPVLDFFAHMFDPNVSHMSGVAISQDGRHALFEHRRTLRVWSLFDASGDQTAITPHASCDMHKNPELAGIAEQGVTRSTALANGGGTVACGTRDGEIVLIEMLTAQQSLRWQAHAGSVSAICFIDGQKRLLSFCTDGESLCCLWSVENGELLQTWLWPHAAPLSVQVGPTGDVLVQADVVVVLDGASLCAPCAELKVRFSCRTGRDGSVMTLHTDGTYSATGADACCLGLTYQGAGGSGAVDAPAWPRFWNALDVADWRSQCDPESIKRHHQATWQPL